MKQLQIWALVVGVGLGCGSWTVGGSAMQVATPTLVRGPSSLAACTAALRTSEETRAVMEFRISESGEKRVDAFSAFAKDLQSGVTPPDQPIASEAVTDEVLAAIEQFYACQAEGNDVLFATNLFSPEFYWSLQTVSFAAMPSVAEERVPTVTPIPNDMVASPTEPTPQRVTVTPNSTIAACRFVLLPFGDVGAVVELSGEDATTVRQDYLMLHETDGIWQIDAAVINIPAGTGCN